MKIMTFAAIKGCVGKIFDAYHKYSTGNFLFKKVNEL